jgi:hypothetical protein
MAGSSTTSSSIAPGATSAARSAASLALGAAAFALLVVGCGRKATTADCDLIFNRYVEVQLRSVHVTDPVEIAKREQSMRGEMKDDLKECPGKRITDSMLRCVQNAQTNDEIDKCTRF